MKRVIIKGPGYCAVMEDGILVEFFPFEATDQSGCVLTGKTDRLMPGVQCAFVDIGRKKRGFLPLNENSGSFTGQKIRSGETMILQIKKEENGEKGAFLTRDITLPGTLVIMMPKNKYIGVSGRITNEEVRKRLKKLGAVIADGRFGLVIRNAAAEAEEEDIRREAEKLYALWQNIEKLSFVYRKPGSLLWMNDPVSRLKADYAAEGFEIIEESIGPGPEISRQLKQASERTLRLPDGGNIVIDRCEAMTVIDVNTGSSTGRESKGRTILETNLEACEMIARQVRLRNLSGIILIDFIDMEQETDRSLVAEKLHECFSCDRIKTVIHGWTHLGLMEMTRKRTGPENQQGE